MTLDLLLWAVGAVLLGAMVALLLAKPLLRPTPVADTALADRAVYRDQLAELERDIARGLLDPAAATAARLEIQRRVLRTAVPDGESGTGGPARPAGLRRWQALLVAIGVPVAALGLYALIGDPALPDAPLAERPADPRTNELAEFERLAGQIEARLATNPADATGWTLLARAHRVLGRFEEAAGDLDHAIALQGGPQNAPVDAVADRGELLVFSHAGKVEPEAKALFEAVVAREPKSAKARHYLALAALQAGDAAAALAGWRALAADAPPDASWLPMVRDRIAATAAALGEPADTGAGARGPSEADVAAAAGMSESDRAAMIRGMVEGLAARLKAAPDDPDGWLRLARAYTVLREPDKARAAYGEAIGRLPDGSPQKAAAEAARAALN